MAAIDFDLGSSACMQQVLTGTGRFTGVFMGRAMLDIGAGPTLTRFRARQYGADGNNISVELVNAGAGAVVPATVASLVGGVNVKVTLRRNAGAILATAAEVASAVNNYRNVSNPLQMLPVVCHAGGVGVVAASGPTSLAGGIDPDVVTPQYKFDLIDTNGGLFYFDQTEPISITQMECMFDAPAIADTVYFKIANLDAGLEPIAAETVTDFTATITPTQIWASFVDAPIILLPRQAFLVYGLNRKGLARVYAKRESRTR
jgi:hypothetical protein